MATPTTFRTAIGDGILAVLDGYKAAHGELLRRTSRARPTNIAAADLPAAFIDARPETVSHSEGIRTRIMSPSVVVVRRPTDNLEDMAAFDSLVDGLMDAFTAVPQFAPVTIWSDMTVADEEYEIGDFLLPAVRFSFPNISIMEGRT